MLKYLLGKRFIYILRTTFEVKLLHYLSLNSQMSMQEVLNKKLGSPNCMKYLSTVFIITFMALNDTSTALTNIETKIKLFAWRTEKNRVNLKNRFLHMRNARLFRIVNICLKYISKEVKFFNFSYIS